MDWIHLNYHVKYGNGVGPEGSGEEVSAIISECAQVVFRQKGWHVQSHGEENKV